MSASAISFAISFNTLPALGPFRTGSPPFLALLSVRKVLDMDPCSHLHSQHAHSLYSASFSQAFFRTHCLHFAFLHLLPQFISLRAQRIPYDVVCALDYPGG
ncbi:hypothetical protein S83_065414 [Arachis hypogaea]